MGYLPPPPMDWLEGDYDMGYNGQPPNYVTQVTAEELIDRIAFLERIWEARATGGDYWLELYSQYWGRYRELYAPARPTPPSGSMPPPPPPKRSDGRHWSPREQAWVRDEEKTTAYSVLM